MKRQTPCSRVSVCFLGLLFYWVISFFSTALALTNQDQAKLAADNFLGFLGSSKTILSSHPINRNLLDPSQPAVIAGWLMDLSGGGYILMASSRTASPVKAYSLKSDYASLPIQYRTFLEQELELYARSETDTAAESLPTIQSVPEKSSAETAWDFLLNRDDADRMVMAYTPDTYLLATTWDQGYPYNKFLPRIDGQQALAGCVNIALAQVMKYHGYPDSGVGTATYSWNNEELKTILYHPYYWENMLDAPGMATAPHLQDEVAILINDLAIVNQTSFGLTYSSAYVKKNDFIRFFGYSSSISSMDNTDIEIFFSTLKAQIDQELPVLLSFPGHMVVVDGYDTDPTGRKFHVNMGWGGQEDNYYYLYETVNAGPYSFEPDLDIIYNVKPCSGPDCIYPDTPVTDIPPQFNTEFKDMIITADEALPVLIRIDVRDENGDEITYSTILSNSDTITADITNDILMIQPLPGSLNKAAALRITARAGGKKVEVDFLVMAAEQPVAFGKEPRMAGIFENDEDAYTHLAILQGDTTINGDRGYSNQAFYISVRNSQGHIIIPDTDGSDDPSSPAIQHNFPFGLYTISASLRSGYTSYTYTPGSDDAYVIQVNSLEFDPGIQQIADLLGIDMTNTSLLPTGDINKDGQVNLEDKILALKIMTLLEDTAFSNTTDDASGDGRVGIEEALFWE